MDLGDIIIFAGVLASIIGSAVGAARKKKGLATSAGKDASSRSTGTASTGVPRQGGEGPTAIKTGLKRRRPQVSARPNPSEPTPAVEAAPPPSTSRTEPVKRRRSHSRWRAAVIAQTVLGRPRGLENKHRPDG